MTDSCASWRVLGARARDIMEPAAKAERPAS